MVAALSACGITELLLYAFGRTEVRGWPSLIAAMCFLGGIQLFFLGVIGEYIGLVFDEVKRRPRYIVDRRYSAGRFSGGDIGEGAGSAHVGRDDHHRELMSERL